MIQKGAKLDAVTIEGKLELTISDNAYESLQALLDLGATSPDVLRDSRTQSLLFEAATCADTTTLEILTDSVFASITEGAMKNEDGLTLQEAFDDAHAEIVDVELIASWKNFLQSINESWHDAIEEPVAK